MFTSSAAQAQADPYNYTNNLDYTLPLALRVKNAGLRWMLDFHYSDTWADPGHQAKPTAWTNLTSTQLNQQMRQYNSNCIAAFKAAGAMPDYVQVGNEITGGFLWPDGQVQYVVALAQVLTGVPDGKVIGAFWWGAEYQPLQGVNLGGCENRSFFGSEGDVLPVAEAFGRLAAPLRLSANPGGGGLTLQWPLSGAASALMTTTHLAPLAVWQPVTNAVQNTGTTFNLTLPWDSVPARFYRLQSN